MVPLFPEAPETPDKSARVPVIDALDGNQYMTSAGLTLTNSPGVITQSYLFSGSANGIRPFEESDKKRVVEIDKVATISSVTVGAIGLTSLGAYAATEAIIVHPLISGMMVIASISFYLMARMKR